MMTDPTDSGTVAPARVAGHWEDVLADMDAAAAEYREAGWETLELHPGDVTVLTGTESDRRGFDVVVPGEDAERLEAALADHDVASTEVYRGVGGDVVFVLAVLELGTDLAVFLPLYYDTGVTADLRELAHRDQLPIHLRPLDQSVVVTVTVDDQSLLLPADGE